MKITVNNETSDYPENLTVRQLLDQLGLAGQYVAVERNREIVPHRTFAETMLHEDDTLEIVTLVGGG